MLDGLVQWTRTNGDIDNFECIEGIIHGYKSNNMTSGTVAGFYYWHGQAHGLACSTYKNGY
jgi:hypothetical protein